MTVFAVIVNRTKYYVVRIVFRHSFYSCRLVAEMSGVTRELPDDLRYNIKTFNLNIRLCLELGVLVVVTNLLVPILPSAR